MAFYGCNYSLDLGYTQIAARFRVFRVQLVEGFQSQFRGEISQTDREFDAQYLPSILSLTDSYCCLPPVNTERHARVYIADNIYLFISCPFVGGTNDHSLFYRQLTENSRIRLIEAHGETVGTAETQNFIRL